MNVSNPVVRQRIRALHRRGYGILCLCDCLAADRSAHPDTGYVLEDPDEHLIGDDTGLPQVFSSEQGAMSAAHERGLAATVLRFTLTDLDGATWTEDLA